MLQQTQVERVLPKYQAFLKRWPNVKHLAEASLGEVLTEWQGLGYNRRAKMLHQCAQTVVEEYGGKFPQSYEALKALPGIGPYTAGAIMAFAYNQAVPIIETNIRTVYLHHFFPSQTDVADTEIMCLIESTLDQQNPREWYWALMDYGSHLKKTVGNQNNRSKSYTKQSTFRGSDREIRGAIIRALSTSNQTETELMRTLSSFTKKRITEQLRKLSDEALIEVCGKKLKLPS